MKANPIPPQYSRWGRFNELAEHNQDRACAKFWTTPRPTKPFRQPIKRSAPFYGSCMNESAVDQSRATRPSSLRWTEFSR
jgi:hypothetical protein